MFLLSFIKINEISYCLTSNAQLSVYIVKIKDDYKKIKTHNFNAINLCIIETFDLLSM